MANHCAGLDPTWAHLPAASQYCHYYSTPSLWPCFPGGAAAAFENEALTSALRASISPAANATASSSSNPTTPSSSSTTSSASELLSAGGGRDDAPAPAPSSTRPGGARAAGAAGPKAGRVTKRKPRPSLRPPVTYITADPANFRRMVQEVTGFPVAAASSDGLHCHSSEPAPSCWPAAPPPPACALPTLDTSAFLLFDRSAAAAAPAGGRPDDDVKCSSGGGASPAMAAAVVTPSAAAEAVEDGDDDDDTSLLLEAMACAPGLVSDDFPTLDSWGII